MTINWNYSEFIIGGSTMTLIGDVVLNPDETFVAVKNSNIFTYTFDGIMRNLSIAPAIDVTNKKITYILPREIFAHQISVRENILFVAVDLDVAIFQNNQDKIISMRHYIENQDIYNGDWLKLIKLKDFYNKTNIPIKIDWFVDSYISPQSNFVIEVMDNADANNWRTIANVQSAEQYYIIPANTLINGVIKIRVTVSVIINGQNVNRISNEIQFIGKGQPPIPIITSVTNTSKPVITWTSLTQIAYKLDIYKQQDDTLICSTGWKWGTDLSHQCIDYLQNGDYIVKLSVKNTDDISSDEAVFNFTINTIKPLKPTVIAEQVENGVRFTVTNTQDKMQLLCNDKLISEFSNATVYDYTNVGTNEYIIRVIDNNDNFEDSNVVTATTIIKGATIALANSPHAIMKLLYNFDSPVQRNKSFVVDSYPTYYSGRKYPVVEISEFRSEKQSFNYSVQEMAEYIMLENLVAKGETLIFRNSFGQKIYGVITALESAYDKNGVRFSFDINTINYEVI